MGKLQIENIKEAARKIDELLRPTSYPVGVKLFKNSDELEKIKDETGRPIRRIEGKNLAVCQIVGQARYYGVIRAATKENASMCMLGAGVLGFDEVPVEYIHGYVAAYFINEEVAENALTNTPMLKEGYEAILVAPLSKIPVVPDVIIFFGNSAQILRLILAYNYNKGERFEFTTNGIAGLCADVIARPILTQKPHVAIPCNGGRVLSWPSDDGLACGIPISALEDIIDGLEFTHRGMIRYPVVWVHLDWEVPEGTIIRNAIRGEGFFPPSKREERVKKFLEEKKRR